MLYEANFLDENLDQEKCLDGCQSAFYKYAGVENGNECYCGNDLKLYSWPSGGGPGPRMPDYPKIIPDIECNIQCPGNVNEKCGGQNRMNIFNIKSKCEKERDDALEFLRQNIGWTGLCYPSCTSTGQYEPLQGCGSTGYEWCVDMNGDEVPGTSRPPGNHDTLKCSPFYTGQCIADKFRALNLEYSDNLMTRDSCETKCSIGNFTFYGLGNGLDCYCGNEIDNDMIFLPLPLCNSPCGGNKSEICGGIESFNLFSLKED